MTQTELIIYGLNHADDNVRKLAELMKATVELDLRDYRDFESYQDLIKGFEFALDNQDRYFANHYATKIQDILSPNSVQNKLIKIQLSQP